MDNFKSYDLSKLNEKFKKYEVVRSSLENGLYINVFHPTKIDNQTKRNTCVGYIEVEYKNITDEYWQTEDVFVDYSERSEGMSTWMYLQVSNFLQKNPKQSKVRTVSGNRLWDRLNTIIKKEL